MKAKYSITVFIFILFTMSCKQNDHFYADFNFNFEEIENGLPKDWIINPISQQFKVAVDSANVKSGKYSLSMEFIGDSVHQHGAVLPSYEKYTGKKITLSGYVKTENVTDGWAGLAMVLMPQVEYIDMRETGISGTTDWKKYEISLNMNPDSTKWINFVVILQGKGKVWFDGLKVTIDGKDIQTIRPVTPEPFSEKAKNDRAFDKGSNIVFPELTKQKIDDLELLGRIWGFLKYHHPAIAKGNYNWDNELFRLLPAYLNAGNNIQRDKILVKWINKYGKIPKCKTCQATSESAFIKPDISWIENSDISLKLKDLLHKIYLNRNQGNHYHIDLTGNMRYSFTNERTYQMMDFPDAGFRLLALYRYWNMIHYFHHINI